ncbi:SOS response-associated peptidase [Gulosibacter molinativorax]|uniref:SOS response-associated peptidase n=1 Tax=Gulosibacter molinativorax TaxID=256821 RepID=UPI00042902C2|nr:SOS response-associated peptidase [Gulosibacter molinativorax]QUY61015.1 Putative SOS response-associated peptidase YedK [Gulosibacter molinativorax]
MARASADLAVELDIEQVPEEPIPESYNVAPTNRIPLVVESKGIRRLELARWGLVPRWAKDISVGVRAINARSETAASKPTFRDAVVKRRGVIPVDGYYEWRKRADGTKQPYFIYPEDRSLMLFAGLYEWWRTPEDEWLLSATILTRDSAGDEMKNLHDRMPVFMTKQDVPTWLAEDTPGDQQLVSDFADRAATVARSLTMHPVDRRVGNVRESGQDLVSPVVED